MRDDLRFPPRAAAGLPAIDAAGLAVDPLPSGPAPRVAVVARELTRGGAAYLALRHAQALRSRFVVDFIVTGPCDESFVGELPGGSSVFRARPGALDLSLRWDEALRSFAVANADLFPFRQTYHAAFGTSTFPDLAACAAFCTLDARRKLLFLVDQSLTFYPDLGPSRAGVARATLAAADLVLPVSRRLRERLGEDCPPLLDRPWMRLAPPVDRDEVRRLGALPQSVIAPGGVPNVLSVGRLAPEKQYSLCLRVHHRLKRQGLRFRWYVVGEGDQGPLGDEIRALGMEDDFLLLGKQENVFPLMKAADALALFSKAEGCPTVVLEALTLGLPVVMTDVNGSDEMVRHEETGLIVDQHPDAIARGLARMVGGDAARHRYRDNLAVRPDWRGEDVLEASVVDLASCRVGPAATRATVREPIGEAWAPGRRSRGGVRGAPAITPP